MFTHLLFRKDEIIIFDMYAGVEHLGRSTVDFVDAMLIVVEPTIRSFRTAHQIVKLASDIGVKRFWLIGNKYNYPDDIHFLKENNLGIPLLGTFPTMSSVLEADRKGISVYDYVPELKSVAVEIALQLKNYFEELTG